MKEVIEAIMLTVTEPYRGMADSKLQIAASMLEQESSAWLPEDSTTIIVLLGILIAGVGTAAYYYMRRK